MLFKEREGKRRRGSKNRQLLDNFKENVRYWTFEGGNTRSHFLEDCSDEAADLSQDTLHDDDDTRETN